MHVRLQKVLSEAGVASRRASEAIILAGRVKVNSQVVQTLGTKVDPAQDRVTVDGKVLRAKRKLYVAVNKPRGCVCSQKDPESRRTLTQLLPKEWRDLYPVGRLDWDTEGLIFLTNDGQFCLRLTHPRYGVRKRYRVTVEGHLESDHLLRMVRGIPDEGELLRAQTARVAAATRLQSVAELELTEGKNHEVRRLFEAQGLKVSRLQRIQIGPVKLGELPAGKWRTLTKSEIKSLMPEL